jgi:hypothetical protein
MVKIFRKVRQDLLSLDKTTRYLVYAFGEIVLVVLGILIALQVNSWAENQKKKVEEQYLLTGLKKDFEQNRESALADYKVNEHNRKASDELLQIIRKEIPVRNQDHIDSLFWRLYSFSSFDANTGVVDEIINSGKLGLIQDPELRFELTQWSGFIRNSEEDIKLRVELIMGQILSIVSQNFPIANIDKFSNYEYWSKNYKRDISHRSEFEFDIDKILNMEFEGLLYFHVVNQDFILINDLEFANFASNVLDLIERNLE